MGAGSGPSPNLRRVPSAHRANALGAGFPHLGFECESGSNVVGAPVPRPPDDSPLARPVGPAPTQPGPGTSGACARAAALAVRGAETSEWRVLSADCRRAPAACHSVFLTVLKHLRNTMGGNYLNSETLATRSGAKCKSNSCTACSGLALARRTRHPAVAVRTPERRGGRTAHHVDLSTC